MTPRLGRWLDVGFPLLSLSLTYYYAAVIVQPLANPWFVTVLHLVTMIIWTWLFAKSLPRAIVSGRGWGPDIGMVLRPVPFPLAPEPMAAAMRRLDDEDPQ